MFENTKLCIILGFVIDVVYLLLMFFVLKAAKDDGLMFLVAFILLCAGGAFCGKAAKSLFNEGFFTRIVGIIIIAIFVLGTLVVAWFAFVGNSTADALALALTI